MHYSVEMARDPSTGSETESRSRVCGKCGAGVPASIGFCTACVLESGMLGTYRDKATHLLGEIGDYQLLEEIGRGGQGVVYRARQMSLNRVVALKVIALGPWATEAHCKRFRREAEAAASLEHPSIVPIYDIDERDGCCYFSMPLVEGKQLDAILQDEPLDFERSAGLILKLARTVHYAHQRGILHRDIKPGNILIDGEGEPHLTDFGLARLLEVDSTITRTIELLGTPSYMSPEQAAGQIQQLTTAADVYGLGAVLYQLVTGRPPFAGETIYETIHLVLEVPPRRPSLLNRKISRDLETICLKCLEKEPAKRYDSAKSLAEDLERFLNGEPIRSRRVSASERVWRWCKRKPIIAALSAALVLIVLSGFGAVVWELQRVQQQELIAQRNLYTADVNLAYQAWTQGNMQRAQTLLRAHLPVRGREGPRAGDLRGFEWRYLWQLCRDQSRFTFRPVNFTPNSRTTVEPRNLVHAGDGHTLVSSSGTTLRWIDMHSGREIKRIDVGHPIDALASASKAPGFLAYSSDKVRCLSPNGEELLGGGVAQEWCNALALSPDGELLASTGVSDSVTVPIRLWNVQTGEKLAEYMPHADVLGATTLLFSPDGRFLVCAETDTRLHVLEVPTLRPVETLIGHTAWIMALAFDPSGTRLASGGNDSQIILWDFAAGKESNRLSGHRGRVSDLAFAADGRTLFSGGRGDSTVRVWGLDTPGKHTILHGHQDGVKSVLLSGDGSEVYSGSYDDTIKAWALPVTDSENVLHGQSGLLSVKFSPDGRLIAAADYSRRTAVFWDVATRRPLDKTIGHHLKQIQRIAFSADGKLLATGGVDDEVQVWDVSATRMVFTITKHRGPYWGMAFHPSRQILALATDNLSFWDVSTQHELELLDEAPPAGAVRVAFSNDGRLLALGMKDGAVDLWDLQTKKRLQRFHQHNTAVGPLSFSADGNLLASGAEDGWLVLYDVERLRPLTSLRGPAVEYRALEFAPDNRTLAAGSWDGTTRFLSLANRQVALTIETGGILGLAFSPDGNLMATSSFDGTLRLWPAPSLADIDAAEKEQR